MYRVTQVVNDLQRKPKDDSRRPSTSAASKCMYIIANVSCKVDISTVLAHGLRRARISIPEYYNKFNLVLSNIDDVIILLV